MSRLEMLTEQTDYLLQAQRKAQTETSTIFTDLLKFIDATIKQTESTDTKQLLEEIHELLSGHAQQFSEDVQGDIEFLEDQLQALGEIKKVSDAKKAKELLSAIIEDEEELPETKEFKSRIVADYEESKKALLEMVTDVKASINEGDAKQVKLFLEALLNENEEDFSEEDLENFKNMLEEDGCDDCDDDCKNCEGHKKESSFGSQDSKNIFTPASSSNKKKK